MNETFRPGASAPSTLPLMKPLGETSLSHLSSVLLVCLMSHDHSLNLPVSYKSAGGDLSTILLSKGFGLKLPLLKVA